VSNFCAGRWRLLPLLVVLAAGCDLPGRPNPADRPVPSDKVTNVNALYTTNCAGCHGVDGKFGPAPPLNDPIFRAIISEAELVQVITEGRAVTPQQKTPMPAFGLGKRPPRTTTQLEVLTELKEQTHTEARQQGPLTADQIKILAEGIKHWGPAASVPRDLTAAGGGGDKDDGLRVFARACAECHGSEGQGGTYGAINERAFLALISDQALRRLAITGRPDLGMPAYNGKEGRPANFEPLTSKEIDNLVALLADWRRGEPSRKKGASSE
jgi:mono/diheme cytochrome c family protein